MGEWEILEYLKTRRVMGDHRFITAREIQKNFRCKYAVETNRQLNQLFAAGYIEVETFNLFHRRFRVKLKYLQEQSNIEVKHEALKV